MRTLLHFLTLLSGMGAAPLPPPPPSPPAIVEVSAAAELPALELRPDHHIGVYLTALSTANRSFFADTIAKVKNAGGSALVINVKDAYVFFETGSPLAKKYHLLRPKYDLKEIVRLAKDHGLTTIARFVAIKDPGLARAAPETQMQHPRTRRSVGATWIDPAHPTVLAYNREILRDVIEAGFDEVNFDYIRYPTEYSPEKIGLTTEEKIKRVEGFLRMARETVKEGRAQTKIGISTYAILAIDFERNIGRLAQDIARFAPLVDIISPMAYPASFGAGFQKPKGFSRSRHYYLVQRTLEGYKRLLGEEQSHKLRPWIQGYSMTPWDIGEEIAAVYDSGLCGFLVWSSSNTYKALYNALPTNKQPEECR